MSSSLNFLLRYATDCTFSSRKMKKFPTVGGGNPPVPHPPPARSLRSLAKIAPPNVLAHYATAVCTRLHHFKQKSEKAPYRGRGDTPSHTLPPLGRYAPSGLAASLPRKDCAPKCFGTLRHCSMHQIAPF